MIRYQRLQGKLRIRPHWIQQLKHAEIIPALTLRYVTVNNRRSQYDGSVHPMPYFKIHRHDDDNDRHHQTLLTPTEIFPACKAAGDVILTAHLHPALSIRMCGAVPLLPHTPFRRRQAKPLPCT